MKFLYVSSDPRFPISFTLAPDQYFLIYPLIFKNPYILDLVLTVEPKKRLFYLLENYLGEHLKPPYYAKGVGSLLSHITVGLVDNLKAKRVAQSQCLSLVMPIAQTDFTAINGDDPDMEAQQMVIARLFDRLIQSLAGRMLECEIKDSDGIYFRDLLPALPAGRRFPFEPVIGVKSDFLAALSRNDEPASPELATKEALSSGTAASSKLRVGYLLLTPDMRKGNLQVSPEMIDSVKWADLGSPTIDCNGEVVYIGEQHTDEEADAILLIYPTDFGGFGIAVLNVNPEHTLVIPTHGMIEMHCGRAHPEGHALLHPGDLLPLQRYAMESGASRVLPNNLKNRPLRNPIFEWEGRRVTALWALVNAAPTPDRLAELRKDFGLGRVSYSTANAHLLGRAEGQMLAVDKLNPEGGALPLLAAYHLDKFESGYSLTRTMDGAQEYCIDPRKKRFLKSVSAKANVMNQIAKKRRAMRVSDPLANPTIETMPDMILRLICVFGEADDLKWLLEKSGGVFNLAAAASNGKTPRDFCAGQADKLRLLDEYASTHEPIAPVAAAAEGVSGGSAAVVVYGMVERALHSGLGALTKP